MSTIKKLAVKHTATFKGEPLVCFRNLPGDDAELRPAQIRDLAAALLIIANDCDAHAKSIRRGVDICREYPVGG
jgi:hypothetical protein